MTNTTQDCLALLRILGVDGSGDLESFSPIDGRAIGSVVQATNVDVAALAAHLGLTERTIRRRVAHGEIPYFKLGHLVRFDPAEIQAWLEEARVAPHVGNSAEHPNGTRS